MIIFNYRNVRKYLNIYDIYQYAIIIVLIMGITIRIIQYLENRSLWLDEAMLAINVVNLDYHELLKPLVYYNQAAPGLFLVLTKIIADNFEYSEYGLRLFPFISGLLSLVLFRTLAVNLLRSPAALIAVIMFAFTYWQIYFSLEFKQYSSDALVTIILMLSGYNIYKQNYSKQSIILYGISGVIAIFISHTSIFIFTGTVTALLIERYRKRRSFHDTNLIKLALLVVIWGILFIANYLIFVKGTDHELFYDYWASGFAPLIPTSISDLMWYPQKFKEIISYPLGLSMMPMVLLAGLAGVIHYFNRNNFFMLSFLLFPVVFLLIASGLKLYPISTRLVFFLNPLFYIVIAEGVYQLYNNLKGMHIILSIVFIVLLLYAPVKIGTGFLSSPQYRQETRPLIDYLRNEYNQNGNLYIYYGAVPAFKYYTRNEKWYYIEGKEFNVNDKYIKQIEDNIRDGEFWLLFSHIDKDEKDYINRFLNQHGELINRKNTFGSSLYQYKIDMRSD